MPTRPDFIPEPNGDTPVRTPKRAGDRSHRTAPRQERAYLVGVDQGTHPGGMTAEESLLELGQLVRTAGGRVVGSSAQHRRHLDPATYVGSGKLDEIVAERENADYSLVVFDDALSPTQQFNLEKALGVKVLDRSALILDIFASRASTREASLQVELAQHEYLMPRLRGQWEHLDRLDGAIGSRGPGETQLETDRRLIGARIVRLKKQIKQVQQQRALQRNRRQRQGLPVVALVGYTNAGKSSLMRALSGADVLAMDAVFATLDPVTRRVGSGEAEAFLLTDTVGFMQKLPTQLLSAFRATLEELQTADLLLHVMDATAGAFEAQRQTVEDTLKDLGLEDTPTLAVVNKVDGLQLEGRVVEREEDLAALAALNPLGLPGEVLYTSATRGLGIDALRRRLLYEFFGATSASAQAAEAARGA